MRNIFKYLFLVFLVNTETINAGCQDTLEVIECTTSSGKEGTKSCIGGRFTSCVPTIDKSLCGDKHIDFGEECDGEANCRANCTKIRCGDGIKDAGEECDGGSGCRKDCTKIKCGNGIKNVGEECDGEANCRANCTKIRCGDGIKDAGEECDDGNSINNDYCTRMCKNTTYDKKCKNNSSKNNNECSEGLICAGYYFSPFITINRCRFHMGIYPVCIFGAIRETVRADEPLRRIDYPKCIQKSNAEYIDKPNHKGWYEKK